MTTNQKLLWGGLGLLGEPGCPLWRRAHRQSYLGCRRRSDGEPGESFERDHSPG